MNLSGQAKYSFPSTARFNGLQCSNVMQMCTIMIKVEDVPQSAESMLPQLINLSASLQEPDDYYVGRTNNTAVLPRSILLFHRDSLTGAHRDDNVHNRYVLLCCLGTSGTMFIDGQMVELQSGHAILIFPHQMHYFIIPTQPINWLFITFELPKSEWLDPLRERLCPILPATEKILCSLLETYAQKALSRKSHSLTHSLGYLLAHLIETNQGQQDDQQDKPAVLHSRSVKIFQEVNQFIYANLGEAFSIETLAEEVGVSASHLRLLVRTQIGMGLGHYINRIRINHAQRLLQDSDLPIKRIAFDCGFNSSQSFARAFRRATGVAPHRYRKHGASGGS